MGDSKAAGQIGKYQLLRLLGVGGMGEVYLARQQGPAGFNKLVVVKRILSNLADEPALVKMFLQEASLVAQLTHPNIASVVELGEEKKQYYLVMEHVHGRSLREILKRANEEGRPLPAVTLALIMAQVLKGLHHAHTARSSDGQPLNIVHRDVTPDNIMVGFSGVVKLLDFGIAKAATATDKTGVGLLKGKVAYLSPEHLRAEPLDGRADIFSVGVTMYEAIAGQRPFVAPSNPAIVHRVINAEPTPLHELAPAVPDVLEGLVMRAMQKKREDRFQSAEEMAEALESWAQGLRDLNPGTGIVEYLRSVYDEQVLRSPTMSDQSSLPGVPLGAGPGAGATYVRGTDTRRRKLWVALGLAAAGVLAAGALYGALRAPEPVEPLKVVTRAAPDAGVRALGERPDASEDLAQAPRDAGAESEAETEAEPDPKPEKVFHGPGRVDLRVIPWGEVFEGKRRLGLTPMPALSLPAGAHVLTVKNGDLGKSREVRVVVRSGRTTAVKIDLME